MRTVHVRLSTSGIDSAIAELEAYKNKIKRNLEDLIEHLAYVGAKEAAQRFGRSEYDGENDVQVSAKKTAKGYDVYAKGEAVAFIEFGAGVYYNGTEPYPQERPAGIVGIGQYGKGFGKRNMWGYINKAGDLVLTRGTPSAMPMYHASQEMQKEIKTVARSVFGL